MGGERLGPKEVGSSVPAPVCGEGWTSTLASTLASAFARRFGAIEKNGIREVFEKTKKKRGEWPAEERRDGTEISVAF